MIATLGHRGPDGHGRYRDDRAGLVHARLALVDLVTGQQPMSNEDDSWWIVFNGEIYNFVELRTELERLGHRFRTHSDTEVIVHAYEAWGPRCFERFNGQWAVALWNRVTHELVLSRDPVGICPLFVREHGNWVWFASEIKAILADPSVPRDIDVRGLAQVFTYWAPIAPLTCVQGVEELRPGSYRIYRDGRRFDGLHWSPQFPDVGEPATMSLEEAAIELRRLLQRATELRILRADVPVGSYLSGGIDSSLIARLGNGFAGQRLRTFSLRFADAEFDETTFQRMMAATLDSDHVEVVVDDRAIADVFPEVVRHAERPLLRTAPAPLHLLSKQVRASGVKAVLTGEGADEMLAGYDIFREARIRAFWARRPESTVRPKLFDRIYPYLARGPASARAMSNAFWRRGLESYGTPGFSHEPRWSSARALQRFFSPQVKAALTNATPADHLASLPERFASWHELSQAQYLEITSLLSPYIISSQGDRQLMANSVEGRFPFLDADVVRFATSLPPGYLLASLDEKHVLKRAARGWIPDAIIERKKQPYRAPDAAAFFRSGTPDYVGELLSPTATSELGVFDPQLVVRLARKCRTGIERGDLLSNADNMAFVGVLSTHLLIRSLDHGLPAGTVTFGTDVDAVSSLGGERRGC